MTDLARPEGAEPSTTTPLTRETVSGQGRPAPDGASESQFASPFVQCEHTFNGTRCRVAAGHGDRHDSDSPVGGFYWFTEPPVPPPHGNTVCVGCEACRLRAARGLPLYA